MALSDDGDGDAFGSILQSEMDAALERIRGTPIAPLEEFVAFDSMVQVEMNAALATHCHAIHAINWTVGPVHRSLWRRLRDVLHGVRCGWTGNWP